MPKFKRTFYLPAGLFAVALFTVSLVIFGQTRSETLVGKRLIAVERQPTDSSELKSSEVEEFDTQNTPSVIRARRIAAFKPGRDLLAASGFPFEPYLLLQDNWRERLANIIRHLPQSRKIRRTGNTISGVQLADTLILPNGVALDGDTVIIANRMNFEGNIFIEKNGHNLYVFLVSEQ
ncbi:MAG: hypothetical protein LC734_06285 [Acidobacteria bacterium]|nr:hypothetical protein [Acidobacteriota bacterium]